MHALIRKLFIRNEKPLYSIPKKIVSTTTREEKRRRDKLLTEYEFIKIKKKETQ